MKQTFRNNLFLSIIIVTLFAQLMSNKFYPSYLLDAISADGQSAAQGIKEAEKNIANIFSEYGYPKIKDNSNHLSFWFSGKPYKEYQKAYWIKHDSILNHYIPKILDTLLSHPRVTYCDGFYHHSAIETQNYSYSKSYYVVFKDIFYYMGETHDDDYYSYSIHTKLSNDKYALHGTKEEGFYWYKITEYSYNSDSYNNFLTSKVIINKRTLESKLNIFFIEDRKFAVGNPKRFSKSLTCENTFPLSDLPPNFVQDSFTTENHFPENAKLIFEFNKPIEVSNLKKMWDSYFINPEYSKTEAQ